ncbi:MAG TPA: GAF domain-containing protein [Alphaproteobacteria bacterium]|nr:GAF domain-containing protein [Alphaproteobacteria bacterium]
MTAQPLEHGAAPAAAAGGRKVLGLRVSALVECALFFGLALAVDFAFLDGGRFADAAPHPFWLAVLLMSVQYGTAEGLLAAALASAALLIGNLPDRTIEQDAFAYAFTLIAQPLLWLAAAATFGEVRGRQIRERDELLAEIATLRQERDGIGAGFKRVTIAKEKLEARVAGQMRTVFTTYQAAKAIERLGTNEVLSGIADLVHAVMSPRKFSLYLHVGNRLVLSREEGWEGDDGYLRSWPVDTALYQAVVGGQRTLAIGRGDDERILAGQGVLAGPLVSRDNGEVVGMLKIEAMDFLSLNISSVENFRVLCDWIGTAYSNAKRFEATRNATAFDPELNLMSASFFQRQTRFLRSLAERVGFDVSMIHLRLATDGEPTRESRMRFAQAIGTTVETVLRATDLGFDQPDGGHTFVVVLPTTNLAGAEVVAEKLKSGVRARLIDQGATGEIVLHTSVQALHSADAEPAALHA